MHRLSIVVAPPHPQASSPRQVHLAASICEVWSCALFAAGADVFSPHQPLDPRQDPFVALGGARGVHLAHDGQPLHPLPDAVVTSRLQFEDRGWRIPIRITRPVVAPTELPGHPHGRISGPLHAMQIGLQHIARALELELPPDFGWRELLGVRTVAQGLDALWQPRQRGAEPPPLHN